MGASRPSSAPNLCCSLQVPDIKPQNNLAPQPSLAGCGSKAHPVGAQHGVLAKPETLPHWPTAPSCPCCPKLPVNSWHFQPLVIQTRNIAKPNLLGLDFLTPWLAAFCFGMGDGMVRTASASWRNKVIFPRREPRNSWHRCPQPWDGPGAAATEGPHKAFSRGTGLFV